MRTITRRYFCEATKVQPRGFSLVELMFVVSILGLLSAVVLVNLSSGRNKANDTAIKANMATIQMQAEVVNYQTTTLLTYARNHPLYNSYGPALAGVNQAVDGCPTTLANSMWVDPTVKAALAAIKKIVSPTLLTCTSDIAARSGHADYVMTAQLSSGKYWCIDSQGFAGERDDSITSGNEQSCQ